MFIFIDIQKSNISYDTQVMQEKEGIVAPQEEVPKVCQELRVSQAPEENAAETQAGHWRHPKEARTE